MINTAFIVFSVIFILLIVLLCILVFIFLKHLKNINNSYLELLKEVVSEFDAKDPYFNGHTRKVSELSFEIAKRRGIKKEKFYNDMKLAIYVGQLAKIRIPEKILYKRDKLTEEEYNVIKRTPIIAYKMLESNNLFSEIKNIVKSKHEKYNGKGYPDGVAGENIPEISRIINISESYDAMVSERPYRNTLTKAQAIKELQEQKGKQFDPAIVDITIEILQEEELNLL